MSTVAENTPRVVLTVDEEFCKGCGLCVRVCPRHALEQIAGINSRGFHPASLVCPDACITIVKRG
jgi:2-oxoglutarate ferredoxin oxidoreductase subunit delta